MLGMRSNYQGVWNIIRFNWPFFLSALVAIFIGLAIAAAVPRAWSWLFLIGSLIAFGSMMVSLVVSWFIYDHSRLYDLSWFKESGLNESASVVNLSAGFDETSEILANALPSNLTSLDFYDPVHHSEPSIRRARQAFPPSPKLLKVSSSSFPFEDESVDLVCLILSAHEIRDSQERVVFFKEVKRILKPNGQVVVIEHLRDWVNFVVYSIGFLHFHSHRSWLETFSSAGLTVASEIKHTPFLSRFTLHK
jgi:ubiquinone/menaquinone biosynthesis C-methylase UbiE